jgi:MFS family permease
MPTDRTRAGRLIGANRDFTLLWAGQAVSALGSTASLITYPLLVLHLTESPALVGLTMATGMVVRLAVGLPGGVLVDRMGKRTLMLCCDLGRAVAQAGIALGLTGGWLSMGLVMGAVAVESTLSSVFGSAEPAAVRHVVRPDQLPLALARNEARGAAAMLAGPPVGGLLFTVAPALPFVFDAASYLLSFVSIALIRTPMRASAESRQLSIGRELAHGLEWMWRHSFLRVTLLLASGLNLVSNAIIVVAVVVSQQRGDSGLTTGLLVTLAGAGTFAGALAAPSVVHRLKVRTILIANRLLWAVLVSLFLIIHNTYALGLLIALMCLAGPIGSTAVTTRQMAVTPDEMQGRASSARGFLAGLAGPLGAGLIGYSLERAGFTVSIVGLTVWLLVLAAIAFGSRAIRSEASAPAASPRGLQDPVR